MTRRQMLSAVSLGLGGSPLALPQQYRGTASRGITPAPRGKPSGFPFHAKFVNVAQHAGLRPTTIYGNERHVDYILDATGCGAAFLDYDNDGWLDVVTLTSRRRAGPTPEDATIRLYRNHRDGPFRDDGWPDIYVARDTTPSLLFRNSRDGTFTGRGLESGVALSEDGREHGGTGLGIGDFDTDGQLDICKTHFSSDTHVLYKNNGNGSFRDVTTRAGLRVETRFVNGAPPSEISTTRAMWKSSS